jgi:hypothetical protein
MQPLERHPPPHAPHPNLINEPENLIRACACMGRTELDAALMGRGAKRFCVAFLLGL